MKKAKLISTKDNKTYELTFDEYGVLDTVKCGETMLSSKNAAVEKFVNNADLIRRGTAPTGFRWA